MSRLHLLWMAAYLLFGAAALHPTMRLVAEAPDRGAVHLGRGRLVALVAAALVPTGVLAVQAVAGLPVSLWAVVVGSVLLVVLVVLRVHDAVRGVSRAARERELLQAHVAHQASHDALTEVPNRTRTLAALEVALHPAGGPAGRATAHGPAVGGGRAVGLAIVDLDRFTQVNERLGPAAGDAVLRAAAVRLRGLVRGDDLVGRLGDDEFAVVLGPRTADELRETADLLAVALRAPFDLAPGPSSDPVTTEVVVGANVGALVASPADTAASLLADARMAVTRAKETGRRRAVVVDAEWHRESAARAELEASLSRGIAAGELVLRYQPVHDLGTGEVEGYEALVRWDRPGAGLVAPDAFVPLAERSELVCDLDRWVLREATRQMCAWVDADPVAFARRTVAVNVSGRSLARGSVVDDVADALRASGLPPSQLVVEITETVLVDASTACEHLAALRATGVRVSIDDFGTGYTSVAQLRHLPADTLKIDRSFLTGSSPAARDLVALMVHAGHSAGLSVVAEGVEERCQLDLLRAAGCDLVQGYLYARPLEPEAVPAHGTTPAPAPGLALPAPVAVVPGSR